MSAVVDRTEAAEYWFKYIDLVPDGDICGIVRERYLRDVPRG